MLARVMRTLHDKVHVLRMHRISALFRLHYSSAGHSFDKCFFISSITTAFKLGDFIIDFDVHLFTCSLNCLI